MNVPRRFLGLGLVCALASISTHASHAPQDPVTESAAPPAESSVPLSQRTVERRVVIDGAVNPELIPDDEVIRVLMTSWAIPPDADARTQQRQRHQTDRLRLSSADVEILRHVLREAYPRITAAGQVLSEARGLTAMRAARTDLKTASMDVWNRILELLSPDGRQKLRDHVAYSKTRIVVRSVR